MRDSSFSQVVQRTAEELGLPIKDVNDVVLEFLNQAGSFLMEQRYLSLTGLGVLRVFIGSKQGEAFINGGKKEGGGFKRRRRIAFRGRVVVSFSKSSRLKKISRMYLEENMLEKYGVDEGTSTEQLEKAAAEGCPECGSKVERHGNVMKCPRCGTKPFEHSAEKEKRKT